MDTLRRIPLRLPYTVSGGISSELHAAGQQTSGPGRTDPCDFQAVHAKLIHKDYQYPDMTVT